MDLVRQSLAVVLVLALLWTALWFVRKQGWSTVRVGRGPKGLLEVRGRLALTPRHSIHLVRIGDRTIAVGVHPEGFTVLADIVSQEAQNDSKDCPS